MRSEPRDTASALDLLALARVPGLGDEGIARVLAHVRRSGASLAEMYDATAAQLRSDYGLRAGPARQVAGRQKELHAEASDLLKRTQEFDIVLLVPGAPDYPAQLAEFYDGAPPLLYARGNVALLNSRCAALLSSAQPTPEALAMTLGLARRLAEAEHTLLTSPEGPAYNVVGAAAKQAGAPAIIVLPQGLFSALEQPHSDPLPLTRRLDGAADLDRMLLVSPFRLDGRWQRGNGPRRDTLLAGLAQVVIGVQVRAGGHMEELCRRAHALRRRVFVCQYAAGTAKGLANPSLVRDGMNPLAGDPAGSNIDLVLRPATPVGAADDDLERRRSLGQFFTPPEVAAFVWDMAAALRGKPLPPAARIIDPACGEGVFLRVAAQRGVPAERLFGVDLDESLWPCWQADPLLRGANLCRTNGLCDNASIALMPDSFDLVIGNPPFSGKGLKDLLRLLEASPAKERYAHRHLHDDAAEANGIQAAGAPLLPWERAVLDALARQLSRYACWRVREESPEEEDLEREASGSLFSDLDPDRVARGSDYDRLAQCIVDWPAAKLLDVTSTDLRQTIKRLASTAVEVFFTERFVQLAKPGGMVAVIVPESILASDQIAGLRAWLLEHTQVLAVVSLPQKVFSGVGANARTGIIFARRLTVTEQQATDSLPRVNLCRILPELMTKKVFMTSPSSELSVPTLQGYLETVLAQAKEFVAGSAEHD